MIKMNYILQFYLYAIAHPKRYKNAMFMFLKPLADTN